MIGFDYAKNMINFFLNEDKILEPQTTSQRPLYTEYYFYLHWHFSISMLVNHPVPEFVMTILESFIPILHNN